jgi:excisionase family DNA binding protein
MASTERILVSVPEAADMLSISRSKLYELLASGEIQSIHIDGARRVLLASLREYVARRLEMEAAA